MDLQDKILGIVEKTMTDAGFEVAKKSNWANTGLLSAEVPGEFGTVASVTYDFQNSYCTLRVWYESPGVREPFNRDFVQMGYADRATFGEFHRYLDGVLRRLAEKLLGKTGTMKPAGKPAAPTSRSVRAVVLATGDMLPCETEEFDGKDWLELKEWTKEGILDALVTSGIMTKRHLSRKGPNGVRYRDTLMVLFNVAMIEHGDKDGSVDDGTAYTIIAVPPEMAPAKKEGGRDAKKKRS